MKQPDRHRHRGRLPGLLLVAVLAVATAVPATAQDADTFASARDAFMSAETPEEKIAMVQQFLAAFPDHEEAGTVLGAGVDVLEHEMEDHAGAVALVEAHLGRTDDPETVAAAQEILLRLYSRPDHVDDLTALVAQMFDPESMSYVDHLKVLEAAALAESWPLVDAHCEAAAPLATAQQFLDDYPDRDFTEDDAADSGKNRQGLLKTFAGWSAANQGDLDQAEREYRAASKLVRKSFLGVPSNELYRFWGQTLLMGGQTNAGLEKLALAAIYGGDHEAEEAALEAFAGLDGPHDFASYLWKMRQKHAPRMVDFTANDYQDEARSYDELKGRSATLVSFWFPT